MRVSQKLQTHSLTLQSGAHTYKAEKTLKHSFDSYTILGTDLSSNEKIIIKSSDAALESGSYLQLLRQANTLQHARHPLIPRLLHFEKKSDQFYLVTPFVEGIPLSERLSAGPLSVLEVFSLAKSLLECLKAAHAEGIVHRDIKPSNVIVRRDDPLQGRLIDFGLSKFIDFESIEVRDLVVGTLLYISPEQAGLIDRPIDERSDLYSLGILLYECLAGKPPFHGESLGEILRQHLYTAPPKIFAGARDIPENLTKFVEHLLEKDPSDRYQSAEGALHDLKEIEIDFKEGRKRSFTIGMNDRRSELTQPSFIGRQDESHRLELAFEKTMRGSAPVISVEAESGCGKTRLFQEFAKKSEIKGARIFWGQGKDQVAQVPFQVFLEVFRSICILSASDSSFKERLRRNLSTEAETLTSIYSGFAEIFAIPVKKSSIGPEEFGEIRSLEALTQLFSNLGSTGQGAILLLDDFQWADELSLRLLSYWIEKRSKNNSLGFHTLIVPAFRSEEVGTSHLLRTLKYDDELKLPPLDFASIKALLESMAGPLPVAVVDRISAACHGSPFMAEALLKGLVENKTLVHQSNGWTFYEFEENLEPSYRAATLIRLRFKTLSPKSLHALKIAAIVGKTFDFSLISAVSDEESIHILSYLDQAAKREIIWERPNGVFVFVHDKLREALIETIPDDQKRNLHLKAAAFLSANKPHDSFGISYHYAAAGEDKRALPFALRAAHEARNRNSVKVAEEQYRIALKALPYTGTFVRVFILMNLAQVLILRGNYAEAQSVLTRALELPLGNFNHAKLLAMQGELSFKEGQIAQASQNLEQALQTLGISIPSRFLFALIGEVFIQALHTIFPRWLYAWKGEMDARHKLIARILSRMAYTYWFGKGRVPCGWAHLKGMNLCENFSPSLEMAQAYSEHGPVVTMIPWFKRGLQYVRKSLEIRTNLEDLWGQGQSNGFLGAVHYSDSNFEKCIDRCRQAIQILKKTGDQWEVNTSNWHIALSDYRLGNLDRAVYLARQVYEDATRIGDKQSTSIATSVWSKASDGNLPLAVLNRAIEDSLGDVHTTAESMQAKGIFFLRNKEYLPAIQIFKEGIDLIENRGFKQEYICPLYPWYATALRIYIESLGVYQKKERDIYIGRLRKAVRKAVRISKTYKNNLPHALREQALLYAIDGRSMKSMTSFSAAIIEARRQNARHEEKLTVRERIRLQEQFHWPEWLDDLEENGVSIEINQPLKAQEQSLSSYNQFQEIMEFGVHLFTDSDRESVLTRITSLVTKLFNADQTIILRIDDTESPVKFIPLTPFENFENSPCQSIVRQSLAHNEPFIFDDQNQITTTESIVLDGIRSAICLPILIDSKVQYIVCGFTRHISKLYGEKEKRLGNFISHVITSALENFEGRQKLKDHRDKLQESNEELERFAYVASHDLQEPLRTIQAWAEILDQSDREQLTDDSKEALKYINQGARRMKALIHALLDYSRASRDGLNRSKVQMRSVIQAAMTNLAVRIKEAEARVEMIGDFPELEVTGLQLTQVFQNLISNAIKFKGTETPHIRISCRLAANRHEWIFSVEDNGIGIDQKNWGRIFEVFKRLHTQTEYEGSGIGLSIAKKIIERHGGRIWLTSELEKGSNFMFSLPRN